MLDCHCSCLDMLRQLKSAHLSASHRPLSVTCSDNLSNIRVVVYPDIAEHVSNLQFISLIILRLLQDEQQADQNHMLRKQLKSLWQPLDLQHASQNFGSNQVRHSDCCSKTQAPTSKPVISVDMHLIVQLHCPPATATCTDTAVKMPLLGSCTQACVDPKP